MSRDLAYEILPGALGGTARISNLTIRAVRLHLRRLYGLWSRGK